MIAMLAPLILAIKYKDAKTLLLLAMTTMHAQKIPAILTLDAFILQSTVTITILALLILALMEIAFIPKKLVMITMHAQLKNVM